jgi:hypothetical protein
MEEVRRMSEIVFMSVGAQGVKTEAKVKVEQPKGEKKLLRCGYCCFGDGSNLGSRPGMICGVRKGGHGSPETYDVTCPKCEGEGELWVWVSK